WMGEVRDSTGARNSWKRSTKFGIWCARKQSRPRQKSRAAERTETSERAESRNAGRSANSPSLSAASPAGAGLGSDRAAQSGRYVGAAALKQGGDRLDRSDPGRRTRH